MRPLSKFVLFTCLNGSQISRWEGKDRGAKVGSKTDFPGISNPGSNPTSGEIPVLVCLCGLPGPMGKACRWLVAISG